MTKKHSAIVLVFNSQKKLALQLRSADDDSYPSHWDFSAAGGIEPAEDHREAAERELREELGIEAHLEYIGEELYRDELCTDQCYVYRTVYDGEFYPDVQEVAEVQFFSLDEIQVMIDTGEKFHPEFPYFWQAGLVTQS